MHFLQMGISPRKLPAENTIFCFLITIAIAGINTISCKAVADRMNSEINKIVMDFLVQEGYPDAAARFAEEANMATNAEDSLIEERVRIKNAIYRGDLQTAIEEINEIDVSVSLTTPTRTTLT